MAELENEIIKRLDRQDETLRDLTRSISEFSQVVARKEVQDQHFAKMHEDTSNRLNNHSERIRLLENIAAGDASKNQIRDWIWKASITIIVAAVGGAIVWAIANQFSNG